MNKIKLSKLTSAEKAFKLIHYANLIGNISYIYHTDKLLGPHDTSVVEKDYKRLKSLLTRAKRIRACITKDDIATNALSFAEHLDRVDATYYRGYITLVFIEMLFKQCLQSDLILNKITRTRVLKEVDINK